MPQHQHTEFKPAYVPPITCKCGGNSHLIRRMLHPAKLGDGSGVEVHIFQCFDCREITETIAEP